jgi:hypothetical protein
MGVQGEDTTLLLKLTENKANMDAATCICGLMFCEADSWGEHVLACKMRVQYEAATSRNVINEMDEAS